MNFGILLESFLMIFLAEMGDKSQFLIIALFAKYRFRDILLGSFLAICLLNVIAVAAGSLLGELLPRHWISLIAGIAFLCFAYMGSQSEEEAEESGVKGKRAVFTVFGTYFLAELGDKTQLTALTLSAGEGAGVSSISVFLGCTAALLAADLIGLGVGAVLEKKLPSSLFSNVSCLLFLVCGTLRILEGAEGILTSVALTSPCAKPLSILSALLAVLLFLILRFKERTRYAKNHPSAKQSLSKQ